jgi:hypothetical protein
MNLNGDSVSDAFVHGNYAGDAERYDAQYVQNLIRKRAYELFEERGRELGYELDDWLSAERECLHHLG